VVAEGSGTSIYYEDIDPMDPDIAKPEAPKRPIIEADDCIVAMVVSLGRRLRCIG
jgi:hypothetical protein